MSGSPLTSVEHSAPKYPFESEAYTSPPGPIPTSARRGDEKSVAIVTGNLCGATAGYCVEPVDAESWQWFGWPPNCESAAAVNVPLTLIIPPPL